MHGIIHVELKNFVVGLFGMNTWQAIRQECGVASNFFLPHTVYPDEQLGELVVAASRHSGIPVQPLLESFGQHLAGALMQSYAALLQPEWRTLDVLEHTEGTIHTVVRLRDPGATPPHLRVVRLGVQHCEVHYSSPRHLCSVARGIIAGIARHLGETIEVEEPTCMLRGDSECRIAVRSQTESLLTSPL